MAGPSDSGVFLERRSYRRRRLIDGARIVPILGAWLFMLPLLWPSVDGHREDPHALSYALTYIFLIWMGLAIASGIFVLVLGRAEPEDERTEAGP